MYTTEQLNQIILRLDGMGNIDLNELKRFDDKLTLFYIFMDNEIDRLKDELKKSNYKFNEIQEKKESETLLDGFRFDNNFISDIKTLKQSIFNIRQELSKIYRNNKNNCTKYVTQKEFLYEKLDFEVKNMKEKYKDKNDKMNKFFIDIDNKFSDFKHTFNELQEKICNK